MNTPQAIRDSMCAACEKCQKAGQDYQLKLEAENERLRELDSDPVKVLAILMENGTLRAELAAARPLIEARTRRSGTWATSTCSSATTGN